MHESHFFTVPTVVKKLYARDVNGRYRVATPDEVLHVARLEVDRVVPQGVEMTAPSLVKGYLRAKLAGLKYEVCGFMLLDTRLRLIEYVQPFRGTLNQAAVYPREVMKLVLDKHAASIIMAHNHPSGLCDASSADKALTQHLKEALALIDVQLLDHIIVAGVDTWSFAEQGLL